MAILQLCFFIALWWSSTHDVEAQLHPLHVYIDGLNGRDCTECLTSNSPKDPCQTLSYVADSLKSATVQIIVLSDWLNLTKAVEFKDFKYLMVSGNQSIIDCPIDNTGLAFVGGKDLSIHSLIIKRCGAKRNSTNVDLKKNVTESTDVALYIFNCTDVVIHDLHVISSNGRGLSLYDTNGTVNITNCLFHNNHENESTQTGGGGLYIEFTFCSPGFVSNCLEHKGMKNSRYFISNSTFSNNIAAIPREKETVISPSNPLSVPRIGKGGGVYISIGSDSWNNTFIIKNCTLYNNSATLVGGGMLTEFLNSVQNTTVSVSDVRFIENHCTHETNCSAGLVIGLMFYRPSQLSGKVPTNNTFICYNCSFDSNIGGGVIIFASKDVCPYRFGNIVFKKGNWTKNTSPMGAAVFMKPGIWDYTQEGCLPVPSFTNCTFESNSAIQSQPSYIKGINIRVTSLGFGTLSVTQFRVTFEGHTLFRNNQGIALHASNSVLNFSEGSVVEFINNTAHKGGAIAMYETSVLQFGNNCRFNFTGNRANSFGGAIYVEFNAAFHPEYRNCFVQPASQNCSKVNTTTFYFEGNYAKANGSSIFATTFISCAFLCHFHNALLPQNVLEQIADFIFKDKSPLATHPTSFELDTNSSVEIVPGAEYYLPLVVKDETGATLTGMVYEATVNGTKNVSIDPAFSQVSHNAIKMIGVPNQTAELYLQASESDVVLSFNVSLSHCQPGYIFNGFQCVCGVTDYLGLVGCDPNVKLKHGYWIGFCSNTDNSKLCTTFCPPGFCSYHNMRPNEDLHPLPDNVTLLDSYICGPKRTGRLCGKCGLNHSVYFHSERYTCGEEKLCYLGWLFYILSEALPLLILFLTILYLNISFTDGNVNCFVLYAQVLDFFSIDADGSIKSKAFIQVIHNILKFIYRPFNLNFFTLEYLSFCLWKGANVLDVMIMKATTVGLALALVVITISIAKCRCARFRILSKFKTPQSVLIHGLSAFFVLCYSQAAQLTFRILNFFCLYTTNFHCEEKAVYLVGYMNYLEGEHVRYAVVAIIALIFMIILPPLLLLLYPLVFKLLGFCKLSESRFATFLWRLMPIQILDAFQSSFKDRFRFFAGFYFLYRAIILAAYAYSETVFQFYSAVQLQLIMVLAIHAIFQPYKKMKHNIIDSLLFTNLAVINAITLFNYTRKDYIERYISQFTINAMEFIQALLILLPFLCIMVHHVIGGIKKRTKAKSDGDLPPLRSSHEHAPLIKPCQENIRP